jgi:RNAse (barnase) inhibitor barstar
MLHARPNPDGVQRSPLYSRPETSILRVSGQPEVFGPYKERATEMQTPLRKDLETPLRGVRTNIVQSIRAFRVQDLQEAAGVLGHHFLYANLAHAQSKQDVLDLIAAQFTFPSHFGKNFDALYDCMTDPLHKSGPQPGFIVVLEQIPATGKFDKEAREQLLDIFRDAADFWGDRKIPFRCFYSFL